MMSFDPQVLQHVAVHPSVFYAWRANQENQWLEIDACFDTSRSPVETTSQVPADYLSAAPDSVEMHVRRGSRIFQAR